MGYHAMTGPSRHVCSSAYDTKRKKHQRAPGTVDWGVELSLSGHSKSSAEAEAEKLKEQEALLLEELTPLMKEAQKADDRQRAAERVYRNCERSDNVEKKELYINLKDAQEINNLGAPLEQELRLKKQYRYYYNRLSKATIPTTITDQRSRTEPAMSVPTIERAGIQDYVEAVSIDKLLSSVTDKNRQYHLLGPIVV